MDSRVVARQGILPEMRAIRALLPQLLLQRRLFVLSLVFAVISAGGLATGLVSIGPMLRIILEGNTGESVATMIAQYNQSQPMIQVPMVLSDLLPADPFNAVAVIMAGIAVLTIIGATANFLHQFFAIELSARAVARVRMDTFKHVLEMNLSTIQTRGAASLISRINKDTQGLHSGYLAFTSKGIAQVTKGLAAFCAAVLFDWRLTFVAIIVAPILGGILRKIGRRIRSATREALKAQEDLQRASNESIQGIRAVKAAGAEPMFEGRFDAANQRVLGEELRVRTARAMTSPITETLAIVVLILLALVATKQILSGDLAFDSFMLALASLGVAGGSLRPLAGIANDIQAAVAPLERLQEVMDQPSEVAATSSFAPLPRHAQSIVFEGVRFRYPEATDDTICGVDLEIKAGEHVAIVGSNGCGKTTLLSLLPLLLEPTDGRILIDGVDTSTVQLQSLRAQIGVVTQDAVLIRASIRDNIAFGRDGDDAAIRAAADRAHATAFIEELPGGFDSPVAEMGTSLSGGQRQRIAIARALFREPSILMLDEATSQIDSESELQINHAIAEFGEGRTALVIAHRLSTVLAADRIVVMADGRIVDDGSHDELIERCKAYQSLARNQLTTA